MSKKNEKIFIQIAAYRDPELLKTLRDCIDKAEKPNNLVSIYCTEVHELNPRHKSDIYIIERIENINQKLKLNNNG
jgi:hypothetical protein